MVSLDSFGSDYFVGSFCIKKIAILIRGSNIVKKFVK